MAETEPTMDALVEAGARAAAAAEARDHIQIGDRINARAILTAVLPIVLAWPRGVLDVAVICLRNRDQNEQETRVVEAGKIAIAHIDALLADEKGEG